MFDNILVPLDGSEIAEKALEPARYLASLGGGRIHLVRAQLLPVGLEDAKEFPIAHETHEAEKRHCARYLKELVDGPLQGVQASFQVLPGGDATTRITEAAQEQQSDLIIMTSRGRSGLGKHMLGSVADKLSRLAACPVMIVGRKSELAMRPREATVVEAPL